MASLEDQAAYLAERQGRPYNEVLNELRRGAQAPTGMEGQVRLNFGPRAPRRKPGSSERFDRAGVIDRDGPVVREGSPAFNAAEERMLRMGQRQPRYRRFADEPYRAGGGMTPPGITPMGTADHARHISDALRGGALGFPQNFALRGPRVIDPRPPDRGMSVLVKNTGGVSTPPGRPATTPGVGAPRPIPGSVNPAAPTRAMAEIYRFGGPTRAVPAPPPAATPARQPLEVTVRPRRNRGAWARAGERYAPGQRGWDPSRPAPSGTYNAPDSRFSRWSPVNAAQGRNVGGTRTMVQDRRGNPIGRANTTGRGYGGGETFRTGGGRSGPSGTSRK